MKNINYMKTECTNICFRVYKEIIMLINCRQLLRYLEK